MGYDPDYFVDDTRHPRQGQGANFETKLKRPNHLYSTATGAEREKLSAYLDDYDTHCVFENIQYFPNTPAALADTRYSILKMAYIIMLVCAVYSDCLSALKSSLCILAAHYISQMPSVLSELIAARYRSARGHQKKEHQL